ncbi:MAG: 50S ribosomal protein L21 [Deltaproteobacteria bacterium]|nr:50S ribosomal protein L21 [Deltaproteobacteria bacterium]
MFAVIKNGGKQYKVAEGDVVRVEKLEGAVGTPVEIGPVLLVSGEQEVRVGQPYVEGARVTGEIVRQGKAPKVTIFKYRRRKGYQKKTGHRQPYTAVKITGIQA